MFLKLQIRCSCGCNYFVSDTITAKIIKCPNCETDYPYSEKIVSLLNTAKEIPYNGFMDNNFSINVISESEDMKRYL